jgi:predicted nucleic acid-binding protein
VRGYLLDTNVISMLAPARAAPVGFVEWLRAEDAAERIFLSAVTIHELEKGIGLLVRKGASAKAAGLRAWVSGLISTFDDRILSIDTEVGAASGRLEALAMAAGHDCGMADALIAGTAEVHALRVVTRNGRHFEPFGIAPVLPEDCRPPG